MVRYRRMTPEEYKSNCSNFKIIYAFHSTPFGKCLLGITNTDKAIVYLAFVDKSNEEGLTKLQDNWPLSELIEDTNNETDETIQKIFNHRVFVDDSILVVLKGTEFQIKVWQSLMNIPEGTTTTYEKVAESIDKPKASRAVGNAVMKNSIGYLVPCHRVKGKSGSSKYAWGPERKESILIHEKKYVNT
nr:PREDICTED: methylated-DNA--protein-cysteine methyltransferase [Megachile rotundata]